MEEDDEVGPPYERDVLKVRVVAHEGLIVVIPFEPEKDSGGQPEVATGIISGASSATVRRCLAVREKRLT